MTQLDLPLARAKDPITSHEAADRITTSGRIKTQRAEILRVVREMPGCTASEIARVLYHQTNHVSCRRLPELEGKGFVRRGAHRACRITSFNAATWWPA
jgi:DNA-binding MarR family transcriptional regulator